MLLHAEVITKANVKDVITAGALTAAQICKGIESALRGGRHQLTLSGEPTSPARRGGRALSALPRPRLEQFAAATGPSSAQREAPS